ncbi:MAG: hypothetical protein OXF30_00920 [Candidatus Saccharibacteria bacterium]|nr:hypothetical protein [Candidatus Saccharibacteria bacterium]
MISENKFLQNITKDKRILLLIIGLLILAIGLFSVAITSGSSDLDDSNNLITQDNSAISSEASQTESQNDSSNSSSETPTDSQSEAVNTSSSTNSPTTSTPIQPVNATNPSSQERENDQSLAHQTDSSSIGDSEQLTTSNDDSAEESVDSSTTADESPESPRSRHSITVSLRQTSDELFFDSSISSTGDEVYKNSTWGYIITNNSQCNAQYFSSMTSYVPDRVRVPSGSLSAKSKLTLTYDDIVGNDFDYRGYYVCFKATLFNTEPDLNSDKAVIVFKNIRIPSNVFPAQIRTPIKSSTLLIGNNTRLMRGVVASHHYVRGSSTTSSDQKIDFPYNEKGQHFGITKELTDNCPTDYAQNDYSVLFVKNELYEVCRVTFTFMIEDMVNQGDSVTYTYPELTKTLTVTQ